jgi:PAS domain S-box-containing protein
VAAPWFEDASIRRKLRIIILVITGLSVVGASTVFLTYDWISSRNTVMRQLAIMAEIVADQSTAAVEFNQPGQAEAILRSLRAEPQIVAAAIYTPEAGLFAHYLREGDGRPLLEAPLPDGRTIENGELLVYVPVQSSGERIGTFYLRSDLAELRHRLLVNLGTVGLVLLGAAFATLFLSARLGELITGPVLGLAAVVHRVSSSRDYGVRAESRGSDELGELIEGFNDMLAQIQTRDEALARARDELEERVRDRTRELEQEILERRATETLLQEAQQIARLGSWEWHPDTGAVTWSDEVYRIYGLLPKDFGGRSEEFLLSAHPDDRRLLQEGLEVARSTREPLALDYRIILRDGSVRWLRAHGKVVMDGEGRPLRLVGTLQDVTERKRSDQAIQDLNRELQARMSELAAVNKELEGFSYSVAHDLRAPLRAIDGFSRMLIEDCAGAVDANGRRYLDIITQNTRQMGKLIDDLLAFSRMGRKALEVHPIDMERVVQEVFSSLKESHPDRGVTLELGPLPPGLGDPSMIRQVFANLLGNSVKYTRGKDPARIEVGARVEGGENLYYVRDNGVGFNQDYSHKLFGVFQRLHSAKDFEGTGVGLALVQRIVQRHRGRVWGEGKLGEGATFFFTLPRAPAESSGGSESPRPLDELLTGP